MPLDSRGADQQHLQPIPSAGPVQRLFARVIGSGLVLAAIAGWLSLITWSSGDPSLTQASAAPARNLLGPLGATLSDLALQLLGFAAAFALLAPLVWGAELILAHRVPRFRLKAGILPFAVLALAGACSAFPTITAWPLRHGFGGIVGDILYNFAVGVCAALGPSRPSAMAALILVCSGVAMFSCSLGLSVRDFAFRARRPRSSQPVQPAAAWRPDFAGAAGEGSRVEPELPFKRPEPTVAGTGRVRELPHPARRRQPRIPLDNAIAEFEDFSWPEDPQGRGAEFDAITDLASRELARRFAPASANAHPASSTRVGSSPASARPREVETRFAGPPGLALLRGADTGKPAPEMSEAVLRGNARLLQDALADLGVLGRITAMRPGPVVTAYVLEPARGTNPSRVLVMTDEIGRSMGLSGVRVGLLEEGSAIRVEIPNTHRKTVFLREVLESETFRSAPAALPLALGKGASGETVVVDLARLPHVLLAGGADSGKSVALNAMVLSLLFRLPPEQCRMLMIDPRMLELSAYNGVPHLLGPVVTQRDQAVAALNWVVREMEQRYERMSGLGVRDIVDFNRQVRRARAEGHSNLALQPMPYLVVVVDEFAELMVAASKDVETAVHQLGRMAAGAGVHLLMATQRPSIDIVTGTLKTNFPARLCFKVGSKIDSRTVLNEAGAEQLLGNGDALLALPGRQSQRLQSAFVSAEEVETVAQFRRRQGQAEKRAA